MAVAALLRRLHSVAGSHGLAPCAAITGNFQLLTLRRPAGCSASVEPWCRRLYSSLSEPAWCWASFWAAKLVKGLPLAMLPLVCGGTG